MMKSTSIALLLCFSWLIGGIASAQEVPYLSGRVNDTAHMLSASTITELENTLKQYEDSTTNQFVVLTINSLEDNTIEEFSVKVAQTWKLGKKGVDNGVLLCISKDDRKIRIEVGYGLEGSLTDAYTSFIINNKITPRFKEKDYDAGVRDGVRAMIDAADGKLDTSTAVEASSNDMSTGGALIFCAFWFSIVGAFTVMGLGTKGFQGWFMYAFLTPFYAGGATVLGSGFSVVLGWTIFCLYIVGYPLLKFLLPATPWGAKFITSISPSASSSGGSSFSSSGSGWSSSSSSSSFSGGGGSFGGGGSSGGW
jgi:uncharacterized protein